MSNSNENKFVEIVIIILSSLILPIIIGWKFIFFNGYIYLHEQFEAYTIEEFWRVVYPLWNDRIQGFNVPEQTKLYLYIPIILVAKIVGSYKVLQALLLFLPYPIAFISSFKLAKYLISRIMDKEFSSEYLLLSAFIVAFIFTVNPWSAINPRNIMLRFQYAFLPLIIYLFLRLLEEKKFKYAISFAILMAILATYRYIFIVTLMLSVVFLSYVFLLQEEILKDRIYRIRLIFIAYIVLGLLSSAKFLPGVLYSYFVPIEAVEQFNLNMVQRETLLHIFTIKIYDWIASSLDVTYDDMTHFLFIFVTIFAFSYLLLKLSKRKKNCFLLFFPPILFIVFVLLSAKEVNIDPIFLKIPFSDFVGRLLRHARWNVMPIVLSISIMAGMSAALLLSRIGNKAYPLLAVILLLTSISAWPMFTGDMNGYWRPAEVPRDYVKVNNILKERGENHHVLWLPGSFLSSRAIWSNQTGISEVTAPTGTFPIKSSAKPSYNIAKIWSSVKPAYFFDYYNLMRGGFLRNPLPVYGGNLSNLLKIYSLLNIKYIVLHYDGNWNRAERKNGLTNKYIKQVASSISTSSSLIKFYEGEYISAYELENDVKEFEIRKPILVTDDLKSIGSIITIQNEKTSAIIFASQLKNFWIELNPSMVITDERNLFPLKSNSKIVSPKKNSQRYAPAKVWSLSSVDYPHFQHSLLNHEIKWSWDFDYGEGIVFTWASKTRLNMSTIIKDGYNYKLFIRYFKNQKGGEIKVYLDGKPIAVKTKDQLNKFVWKELGTFYLEKGKHEIVLENAEGFNAVNLFVLIPEEEYKKAKKEVEKLLQNKTIIYLFEAESDLYRLNAKTIKDINFSNGEALLFQNGKAWQDIEIIKNGTYRLALRGVGSFEISIDNKTFELTTNSLNFLYTPMFYLGRGVYKLEITPLSDNAILDVVWMYSTETNQTIDQLFEVKEKPAKVISYEKINPTLWKVRVNATKPFMLSFAEAYDPLWEARVYKDGKKIEIVRSIPLYSVINGFWINETGDLEIVIRYKPQDWFERGLIISLTTFIGCIGYLFYDWRKEKGDKWALKLKLRQKIKKLIKKK